MPSQHPHQPTGTEGREKMEMEKKSGRQKMRELDWAWAMAELDWTIPDNLDWTIPGDAFAIMPDFENWEIPADAFETQTNLK